MSYGIWLKFLLEDTENLTLSWGAILADIEIWWKSQVQLYRHDLCFKVWKDGKVQKQFSVSRRTSILSLLSISIINSTCRHYPGKILVEFGGGGEMFQSNCTQSLTETAECYCKMNHVNHCYAENSVQLQKIWAVSLKVIFYTKLNVITVFPAFRTQPLTR